MLFSGCIQTSKSEITIGLQNTPSSAIVLVAAEKGFFAQNGLDVKLEDFTAGKFALQAFLSGSVDLAVAGDVPIVLATMQGNDFYVLVQTVESTQENPVIVLDDFIEGPKEYFLKTKRKLTTSIGGTPEFYTYNFLKYYEIPEDQVEIIAQKPEEMVAAFVASSVDAMSIFEPYPTLSEDLLPGKTKRFEIPSKVYSPLYVLAANKVWVDKNPEKAVDLLNALVLAEKFIEKNPAESQKIVAQKTKFSEELIRSIWSQYTIKAVITERLLEYWNAEAVWAIETGKVNEIVPLDFEILLRKDLLNQARGD
ncbi:ABC transporter substrate-binding protein [Candidatus Micrarchaeota archaeon]|nr:ABC transporter substrate-binding protein [Candidatus Micrarchaeota archaeon]